MRPDVDQLAAFVAVVELGSFSKAANHLLVSKSIISRRISLLEDELGVRLLSRSTHYVTPTALGHAFNERARRILHEIDDTVGFLKGSISEVSGIVRITSPTTFGTLYLNPAVRDLMTRYPQLEISLDLSDRAGDPFTDGADFAIRIGILKDSTLVSRCFKAVRQVLVCSPAYAERRGLPDSPRDIFKHECLIYQDPYCPAQWRFMVDGNWETAKPTGRLRTNNPSAAVEAAEAGLGLAVVPMFTASSAIDRGALIQVFPQFPLEELGLHAVFPPNPMLPAKVRAVVDFLAARWHKPLPEPKQQLPAREVTVPVANGHDGVHHRANGSHILVDLPVNGGVS
ncbi:LysR family transcriptional regulator [Paraburkholderia fungorum]|uniref:LysR family transcriptional regulator n=1 Tax=Paraburkholderia fungorum TaxID=134537 RepID=UPI001621A5CA